MSEYASKHTRAVPRVSDEESVEILKKIKTIVDEENKIPAGQNMLMEEEEKNIIEFPDLGLGFSATGHRMIVLIDPWVNPTACQSCGGTGVLILKGGIPCESCRGKGALVMIPEISKSIPSTGVVVSLGESCRAWTDPTCKMRIGARVIFGPYVGTFLPFKNAIKLKIMNETDPLAFIYGAAKLGEFVDEEAASGQL
jgi:co-chaperonin GroES (HSP10)